MTLSAFLTGANQKGTAGVFQKSTDLPGAPKVRCKQKFYKTRLCPLGKECWKKQRCTYAHDPLELKSAVTLDKTRLCVNELCNDPDCHFAHHPIELRTTADLYKSRLCLLSTCDLFECRQSHLIEEKALLKMMIKNGLIYLVNGCVLHADYYAALENLDPGYCPEARSAQLFYCGRNIYPEFPLQGTQGFKFPCFDRGFDRASSSSSSSLMLNPLHTLTPPMPMPNIYSQSSMDSQGPSPAACGEFVNMPWSYLPKDVLKLTHPSYHPSSQSSMFSQEIPSMFPREVPTLPNLSWHFH